MTTRAPLGTPEMWLGWLLREVEKSHKENCGWYCGPLNHDIECTRNAFRRRDAKEIISKALTQASADKTAEGKSEPDQEDKNA